MSPHAKTISIFGNEWGLLELPRRPSPVTWSFEEALDKIAEAGFDGCQADVSRADVVRKAGLRFAASGRVDTPSDARPLIERAAAAGAEILTLHAGWGGETDEEAGRLVESILAASQQVGLAVAVETHRATILQDVFRARKLLDQFPELLINADFSHFYCGQEFGYRGADTHLEALDPFIRRARFIHARVSDGQCMQCDLADPLNEPHLRWFQDRWRAIFEHWAAIGFQGIFTPELGPPSSRYSITHPGPSGERIELADRWRDTLALAAFARGWARS